MPDPKKPPLSPVTGRPMAAHVREAVLGPLQAKLKEPMGGGRSVAAHVQTAIEVGRGVGAQPKTAGPGVGGRQVAAHVQTVIAAGRGVGEQPKTGGVAADGWQVAARLQTVIAAAVQQKVSAVAGDLPAQPQPVPVSRRRKLIQPATEEKKRPTGAGSVSQTLNLERVAHVIDNHVGGEEEWALAHGKGQFNPTFLKACGKDAKSALSAIAHDLLAHGARGAPTVNDSGETVVEYYRKYSDLKDIGVPTGWTMRNKNDADYNSGVTMRCQVDGETLTLLTMFPAGRHPYRDPGPSDGPGSSGPPDPPLGAAKGSRHS